MPHAHRHTRVCAWMHPCPAILLPVLRKRDFRQAQKSRGTASRFSASAAPPPRQLPPRAPVPGLPFAPGADPHLELHRLLHGAQVDGDVGGVGDQPAVRAKEGAGEVQPLLDVGGDGRALQDSAHLLCSGREEAVLSGGGHPARGGGQLPSPTLTCNAHEAMGEDGQLDGVKLRPNWAEGAGAHRDADVSQGRHGGCAAGLQQDGAAGGQRVPSVAACGSHSAPPPPRTTNSGHQESHEPTVGTPVILFTC